MANIKIDSNKVFTQYVSSYIQGGLFIIFLVLAAVISTLVLKKFNIDNFFAFAITTICLTSVLDFSAKTLWKKFFTKPSPKIDD